MKRIIGALLTFIGAGVALQGSDSDNAGTAFVNDTLDAQEIKQLAQETDSRFFNNKIGQLVGYDFIAGIALTESSGRLDAVGDGGRSIGLLQVQKQIARNLHDQGYNAKNPANLAGEKTNIYFAMALIDQLSNDPRFDGSKQWLARAYNGGPDWQEDDPSVIDKTARYWDTVKENIQQTRLA